MVAVRIDRSDDGDGSARNLRNVGRQDVNDGGSFTERGERPADPALEGVPEGTYPEGVRPAEVAAEPGDSGQPGDDAEQPGGEVGQPREPGTAEERATLELDYRATVETANRAYAIDQAYEKIRDLERNTVTPAMRRIESEDPARHLAGLENSRKGKDRLAEKVHFDVQKSGVQVYQAIANVKDAIRYTFCYPEDSYTQGVYADCNRLAEKGFELVNRRNSWDKEQYKGINSSWRVPENGQLFEVQFHTQASLDAKEETHWAYEKLRVGVPTQDEQHELEDYQTRITARVPIPPGALDIPDYP